MIDHNTHGAIQTFAHHMTRASPIIGGAVVLAVAVMESEVGPNSLWVSGIGIVVGVFITLTGMLYHNLENRLTDLEKESLPRREFDIGHKSVQDQLERIEKHLSNTDNIVDRKSTRLNSSHAN